MERNKRFELRLTAPELELLDKCADELHTTRTKTVVIGIEKLSEELGVRDGKEVDDGNKRTDGGRGSEVSE